MGVATTVADAVVQEEAHKVETRRGSSRLSDQRKRTSWTWASTWTSRSPSSSAAAAKVSQWLEASDNEADKTTSTPTKLQQGDANDPQVIGTLKGYDQLMNLVLDEVKEAMTGTPSMCALSMTQLTAHTDDEGNVRYRKLGLIVARGTLLVVVSPVDGSEEIANPFIQEEE